MKKNIHPNYKKASVSCACGNTFTTRSTKKEIRVRMAIVDEAVWPPPATEKPEKPNPANRIPYSEMISGGRLDVKDVIQPIYDEINKEYGLDEKQE